MTSSRISFHILFLNGLSKFVGAICELRLPRVVAPTLLGFMARLLGIDLDESDPSIEEMRSFQDLFTRRLKEGSRKYEGDLCAPCDGVQTQVGPITRDAKAIQIKNITYSLDKLIGSHSLRPFLSGYYSTIYLAPHNYHRVHSPINGKLVKIEYVPGCLWPVNPPAVRLIPSLFLQNERLIFILESPVRGLVAVVMVGALNVGKMRSQFLPDFETNNQIISRSKSDLPGQIWDLSQSINKGEELGIFMMGSTVVMLSGPAFGKNMLTHEDKSKTVVRLGQSMTGGS